MKKRISERIWKVRIGDDRSVLLKLRNYSFNFKDSKMFFIIYHKQRKKIDLQSLIFTKDFNFF